MGILEEVKKMYEERPYPPVSFLTPFTQRIRKDDLPLLNYEAGYSACFGQIPDLPTPRILVAGSGTVEPIAVALANPNAKILAVDISKNSLDKLAWMAKCRGLSGQIQILQCAVEELTPTLGKFDYIIASGLIHHLQDPQHGLHSLQNMGHEKTVFRIMAYSKWGRELLYRAKEMAQGLGITKPKELRKMMEALPSGHPYRIYFHLYSDSVTDAGISDGYLHPQDRPFEAMELGSLLSGNGLEARKFLHRFGGNPCALDTQNQLSDWQKLAVLEVYGELQDNFLFFASKREVQSAIPRPNARWKWNPCISSRTKYFSKIEGELFAVGSDDPGKINPTLHAKLCEALFLLPYTRGGD